MIKCAAALSGNGVTMRLLMALLRMERQSMPTEEIMAKISMMAISAWMGLVYPDRTAHTGLLEYKNVYRPARVVSYDKKVESWYFTIIWILMT